MNEFEEKRDAENCQRCNYDTHVCPGCGAPLPHGTEVCDDCDMRTRVEAEEDQRYCTDERFW